MENENERLRQAEDQRGGGRRKESGEVRRYDICTYVYVSTLESESCLCITYVNHACFFIKNKISFVSDFYFTEIRSGRDLINQYSIDITSFPITIMSSFATVATVAFAIFFAAVAITMVLPEMSSDTLVWYFIPNNSLNPAGRVQLFNLHPNNADIAALMFSTLPTLALINVLLSFRTHLAKILIILTWIVSLFILEEIFFIELLHPELFVAVLVLSTMENDLTLL